MLPVLLVAVFLEAAAGVLAESLLEALLVAWLIGSPV